MINSFDTVEELFKKIKSVVSSSFPYIAVKGEISSISYPSSGHIYFKIKDKSTALTCMCLKTNIKYLSNKLEENKEIIIVGKISAFAKSGQLYITVHDALNPSEGKLNKSLEERKEALKAQGYFDANTKKQIPSLTNTIGIITSSQGAVQHDIINRINDRRPCKLVFFYSTMQGENTESEVIKGLHYFNNLKENKVDVIIIARGGGSLEDLEVFNSEKIVKAVYESKTPTISAIGHETDFSFVDFTADLRASTPTAAAEIVTAITKKDLLQKVQIAKNKIQTSYKNYITKQSERLEKLNKNIAKESENKLKYKGFLLNSLKDRLVLPQSYLNHIQYKLTNIDARFKSLAKQKLKTKQQSLLTKQETLNKESFSILYKLSNKLELENTKLEKYNNKELLKKGFAIVKDADQKIVKSITNLKEGKSYQITMQNGSKDITILDK